MNALAQPVLDVRRTGRITGSRVSAVLGLSPYQSPDDCLRQMVREYFGAASEFTGNVATEHGQRHEPDALAAYEARYGIMCHGGGELVIHPEHDFLAVTPDGLCGDEGLVEVKAPYRASYTDITERPDYFAQVQLQLACTGRLWCHFVIWRDGEISINGVNYDSEWLAGVMPALVAFMARYHAAIASDEAAAPHLADKERKDFDWREAASVYRAAKQALDAAQEDETSARAMLLALAPGGAKGCGVTLSRAERTGSVDYARALKQAAPDFDVEPFRKSGSVVYSVRVA